MNSGLNSDFGQFAVMHTADMDWQASPVPGVWRKRLDLAGEAETSRVTSIVRYDAGSSFHTHPHPNGEEILVLEGVFSDHTGDYGVGSYLLNPEGFTHAPFSKEGCVLLVKLQQYPGKRPHIMLRTQEMDWQQGSMDGVRLKALYGETDQPESVKLMEIEGGTDFPEHCHDGGEEVFVLHGRVADEYGELKTGSWARYPRGSHHAPRVLEDTLVYVKSGHLD